MTRVRLSDFCATVDIALGLVLAVEPDRRPAILALHMLAATRRVQ